MLDVGTLRVITARELVVLSGSSTSHSKLVRWHRQLRGHGSHEQFTVSNIKGEKQISTSIYRAQYSMVESEGQIIVGEISVKKKGKFPGMMFFTYT